VAGGSIVREVSAEQVGESLALLIRYQKVALPQLAEFREGIEGNVAALAAERATASDIKRLRELLARAGEQLALGATGWDEFIRVDEELHRALAEITGNPLYSAVLATVSENIHTYYESFLARDEALLRENYTDLEALVTAVDKREAERARQLAQDHVRKFSAHMQGR
jgi:DNA-binding FadR family transcriptional regulator